MRNSFGFFSLAMAFSTSAGLLSYAAITNRCSAAISEYFIGLMLVIVTALLSAAPPWL